VRGQTHQVRRVSQPGYQNCESPSINTKRHKISLSRQPSGYRSFPSGQCAGGNGLFAPPECAAIRAWVPDRTISIIAMGCGARPP
jgi:hypothetical protein